MTASTCPVHGEYSASGVCRWCEEPSGADQSAITLPLMCICKTCLRGFEAPIPLTSLECPECRAKEQPAPSPLPEGYTRCRCGWIGWTPDARKPLREEYNGMTHSPEQCYAMAATPPPEPLTLLGFLKAWERLHPVSTDATMWVAWERQLATLEESRLLYQHAALRWERVARRWNWKHREPRWINKEWRAYVWRCWLEQMALRREGNLIAAGIPKEWP